MLKETRELLEWNDLLQLHLQFEKMKDKSIENENAEMPILDNPIRRDIWTEAINAASEMNLTDIRKVYTRIMHSDLALDGKKWWDSVLSISMEAPLEELERVLKESKIRQPTKISEYISVAANKLAHDAVEQERKVRRKKAMEERTHLEKLQEEADKCQQEKDISERDLEKHRKSQGGR